MKFDEFYQVLIGAVSQDDKSSTDECQQDGLNDDGYHHAPSLVEGLGKVEKARPEGRIDNQEDRGQGARAVGVEGVVKVGKWQWRNAVRSAKQERFSNSIQQRILETRPLVLIVVLGGRVGPR